ncbi:MAG TPA: hypothetical protein PKX40_10400, partial [Spirochaetota bacterium]|nr:hypothetical protein [Spirochaetota bacterium]
LTPTRSHPQTAIATSTSNNPSDLIFMYILLIIRILAIEVSGGYYLSSAKWNRIIYNKSSRYQAKQDVLRDARMVQEEPSAAKQPMKFVHRRTSNKQVITAKLDNRAYAFLIILITISNHPTRVK